MKQPKRLLPFVVSGLLLVVLISYAPWGEVVDLLADFDLGSILVLIGLSLGYYGLKAWRFYYLLQAMGIQQPFRLVALSYISAQPVSLLPAGEIYRSHALEKQTGVPVRQSLPQFTIQGLLEGGAMAALGLVSALALGTLRVAALVLMLLMLGMIIGIRRGHFTNFVQLLNRLPFITITSNTVEEFNRKHRQVLSRQHLPTLFAMSVAIELMGTAIAFISVVAIGGHINFFQAALLYIVPVIVGFLSLLPGGIGLSEQSAIGILLLADVSIANAVAATLIMRLTISGLGVLYGVICHAIGMTRLKRLKQVSA